MPILRGPDGQFYDVPADLLASYQVNEPPPQPGPEPAMVSIAGVIIQVFPRGGPGGIPLIRIGPAGSLPPVAPGEGNAVQPYQCWPSPTTWRNGGGISDTPDSGPLGTGPFPAPWRNGGRPPWVGPYGPNS